MIFFGGLVDYIGGRDFQGSGVDRREPGDQFLGRRQWKLAPEFFRGGVVERLNFAHQLFSLRGQDDAKRPTIGGMFVALDEAARHEPVHEAGDVGTMHDQLATQFHLGTAFRTSIEQVENIELAGTEVPPREKNPAGVPERVGQAQEFNRK